MTEKIKLLQGDYLLFPAPLVAVPRLPFRPNPIKGGHQFQSLMIDSHCHLEFKHFDEDREEVVGRAKEELRAVVDSCAEVEMAEWVLDLHREHPDFVFPCLGLHPEAAGESSREKLEKYEETIEENRREIVAIGEVGLDHHHVRDPARRRKCEEVFLDFVELSNELDLPLVVHSRNSMEEAIKILREKEGGVMIHCFSGGPDHLRDALDRGYLLSFGGAIFRSKRRYEALLNDMSLENLLLETDAPFLAKEKGERSEPWFIREVAERIAEIKEVEFAEVWERAGKNAVEFFDLPIDLDARGDGT